MARLNYAAGSPLRHKMPGKIPMVKFMSQGKNLLPVLARSFALAAAMPPASSTAFQMGTGFTKFSAFRREIAARFSLKSKTKLIGDIYFTFVNQN